jgi:hypothetical protein
MSKKFQRQYLTKPGKMKTSVLELTLLDPDKLEKLTERGLMIR